MDKSFSTLTERFIVAKGDEEKPCLLRGDSRCSNYIGSMDVAKRTSAKLHKKIMQGYRSEPACRSSLRELYETTVTTYQGPVLSELEGEMAQDERGNLYMVVRNRKPTDDMLCGELVKDAMETFCQVATDPETESMTALHALGYVGQLGRDPLLLQMKSPSPYVDMMMDTVLECAATGKGELRKKAIRMNRGLVYDEGLAPYLTGYFVSKSGLFSLPVDTVKLARNNPRIRTFQHLVATMRDIQGRDNLVKEAAGRYASSRDELVTCTSKREVPSVQTAVRASVYAAMMKPPVAVPKN